MRGEKGKEGGVKTVNLNGMGSSGVVGNFLLWER